MFAAALIIVLLHIVFSMVSLRARPKRKNWIQKNVVYLPFYLACVGMVCGTILSIPTVACAADQDWMFAFFGIVVLACDCMMIAYVNCVIWYDDKGFKARNFLGIKRVCSYKEVAGIRSGKDRRVYFKGHCIFIDEISCGGDEFIEALDKGYKRATGKWMPTIQRKRDPMNGHLDHPWFYFTLWIIMGLFCVSLPVLVFVVMTSKTDPAEINVRNIQFSSYEIDDDALLLYVEGKEEPYRISYYKYHGEALPAPEMLCSGEVFAVGVEGNRYSVKSLTGADGTKYITLESERQAYRDSQKVACWILCLVSPIGIYFCYLGIAVARNPDRYSARVRSLFYKDGFLH